MSLNLNNFTGIYLHRAPVDFRKSIDGLAAIVVQQMAGNLKSGNLFVFTSRRRDRLKILYFDRTGYALWYKRLESARFKWPGHIEEPVLKMRTRELEMMLDGFDVWRMKPHEAVHLNQEY